MIAEKDSNVTIIKDSYIEDSYFFNLFLSFDEVNLGFRANLVKDDSLLKRISEYEHEMALREGEVARKNLQKHTIKLNYGENHYVDRVISIYQGKYAKKDFYPKYLEGNKWIEKLGDDRSKWQLYRREYFPYCVDKWMLWHEGEKAADYALSRGLISTCVCGSLAKDQDYIKSKMSELAWLHKGIVFIADNDKIGKDKANELMSIAIELGILAIVLPIELLYPEAKKGDDFVEYCQSVSQTDNENLKAIIEGGIALNKDKLKEIIKEIITKPDAKKVIKIEEDNEAYDNIINNPSEYGKVILAGEEARHRASIAVTQNDLKEHSAITIEQLKVAVDHNEFSEFQAELIRQYNKLSKKYKIGFGNGVVRIPDFGKEKIIFNPDTFYLTIKEDFNNEPTIEIPKKYSDCNNRAKIINHLRMIGVKYVFDNSQTGGGKSATVSKLNNILYLDTNYKNPSNPELKTAADLTPRTYYGLYMVNGEVKADPNEEIRLKGEDPNYPNIYKIAEGNCHLKPAFTNLQSKGYPVTDNLPCQKCEFKKTCSFTGGLYKHETKKDIANILGYGIGRMHPSQLTTEKLMKTFPHFGLVWEEVGTLPIINEYHYTTKELKDLIIKLLQADDSVIEGKKKDQIINVVTWLIGMIDPQNGRQYIESGSKYFGLPHNIIKENMPELPELNNDEYLSLVQFLDPKLEETLPNTNFSFEEVKHVSNKFKEKRRQEEKEIRSHKRSELMDNVESLPINPYHLLEAIFALNPTSILSTQKITKKNNTQKITQKNNTQWVLGVSSYNETYSNLAKLSKFNLFMDATATATQVKAIFSISDEPLVTIQNEKVPLDNLKVFNIDIQGLGSNEWSTEAIERAKTGIELIKAQNPHKKIAVMTLKRYAKNLNTPYWYGKHDRGTNELLGYDAIIFVGTPYINIGAVQREYDILFSNRDNSPTFEQYYLQKIYELRMQGLGRSRAQHFKEKIIHQFYLTTNEDLSYLKEMGLEYKEVDGVILSPELGSKGDRTLTKIKATALSLVKSGVKATCEAVGKALNLTKQAVSKAVNSLGLTWKEFIFCQLSLLESYIGEVDKTGGEIHWSEYEMKDNPQHLIKIVMDNIKEKGVSGFLEVVKGLELPYYMASRLLWAVSPLFDDRLPDLSINVSAMVFGGIDNNVKM